MPSFARWETATTYDKGARALRKCCTVTTREVVNGKTVVEDLPGSRAYVLHVNTVHVRFASTASIFNL